MAYSKELEISIDVAKRVGSRIAEVLNNAQELDVSLKGRTDLVTNFDVWAEGEITTSLKEAFPEYLMIGEETADALQEQQGQSLEEIAAKNICWVVDPIDGTSNFVNRIPHVGVSIGLVVEGKPVMGVVYDPCRDETFSAEQGQGAYLNSQAISVGQKTELIDSLIATGFPYEKERGWNVCKETFEAFIHAARGVRRFGAATLDGSWVACGRYDGFFEYGLHPWDVAAISVIVEEAGGAAANAERDEYSIFANSFVFAPKQMIDPMKALMKNQ